MDTERPPERITKDEVNALPLLAFEGEVKVINRDHQIEAALEDLSSLPLIGFDTETRPVFKRVDASRHPAILQLSGPRRCYIFQLKQLRHPERTFRILSDERVVKTGVAIRDDIRHLQAISSFEPRSFEDLSNIAAGLGIVTVGLRNLAAIFLKGRLSKRARLSNWEAPRLSAAQLRYAATDAWISLRLHESMKEHPPVAPVPPEAPAGD